MEQNNYYKDLISNLGKAILALENQVLKDKLYCKNPEVWGKLASARDKIKTLTWYKVEIMNLLMKAGLLKY